jgi:hypothetical protein
MPSFNTAFMTSFRQRHLEDDIDDAATPFPTLSAESPSRSSSSATLSSSSSTVSSHYREQELQKENEPNHVRLRRILDSAGGYDSMYPGSRKRRRVQSMPHDADRFVAGPSEGDARILFNAWRPSKRIPLNPHPILLPFLLCRCTTFLEILVKPSCAITSSSPHHLATPSSPNHPMPILSTILVQMVLWPNGGPGFDPTLLSTVLLNVRGIMVLQQMSRQGAYPV